jgi:hypothetical protein
MCNLTEYSRKTDAELRYIQKDAHEAAVCAHDLGNYEAACKYMDQINDASTILYRRQQAARRA